MDCVKKPHLLLREQQQMIAAMNQQQQAPSQRRVMTTLHGYEMVGPLTPAKDSVWYCDHRFCTYTKHGLYRKYRIQNWRSSRFGAKFVLCDGCVRQYEKQKPVQYIVQPPQVNVDVKLNADQQLIQNQPEGVTSVTRTVTYT